MSRHIPTLSGYLQVYCPGLRRSRNRQSSRFSTDSRKAFSTDGNRATLLDRDEADIVQRPSNNPPNVIVIDDDPDVREGLGRLLRSVGFHFRLFASASEFFKADLPDGPICLVVDVRMPGKSGLDLQEELSRGAKRQLPLVFITGHGDVPMSVQAMKGGAIEFLTKPFRDQDLLDAVAVGHTQDRRWLEHVEDLSALQLRYESLSPRERQVMMCVATGLLNKQIAAKLAISEITVKVHRGQVMRKMRASSLPDLTRMSDKLQLLFPKPLKLGRAS
jgi:FixJ family two-component response regulator